MLCKRMTMSDRDRQILSTPATHEVLRPAVQTLPLVLASPHSGRDYPKDFVARARLDPRQLRRSEDAFVDELFGAGVQLGAPLLRALFPRAFVDPNREPFELDPSMFLDRLPDYANTRSPRVAAGLGTIARVVANGAEIYRDKLTVAEALQRIRTFYWPYHKALKELVDETVERFGVCVLVDCHSMPSGGAGTAAGDDMAADLATELGSRPLGGGKAESAAEARRVDVVLGDCHGTACGPLVVEKATAVLQGLGYRVSRNQPYSGGFVTRHYGRPDEGLHALQIEINRALYMNESTFGRTRSFERVSADMARLVAALGELDGRVLAPR
jgi:N-formylglutamate amidohydrolase